MKRSEAQRGASFVELLIAGVLLLLLLGAMMLMQRFVAPPYRPLVLDSYTKLYQLEPIVFPPSR
jgi:hypothetical protein